MSRPRARQTRTVLAELRAAREIPAASFEAYQRRRRTPEIEADPDSAPAALVDELCDLAEGRAVLRLPDGSRWFFLNALVGSQRYPVEIDAPGVYLDTLRWDHSVRAECMPDHDADDLYLDVDRLDLTRVWCDGCGAWVDLLADSVLAADSWTKESPEMMGPTARQQAQRATKLAKLRTVTP